MSVLSDAGQEPGDIMRRLRELEQQVRDLQTARRLESAAIGSGGLRVKDGGRIQILDDNGEVQLDLAAEGMTLEGLLQVLGRMEWLDEQGIPRILLRALSDGVEGNLTYRSSASGSAEVAIGTLFIDGQPSHGLLVQRNNGDDLLRVLSGGPSEQVALRYLNTDQSGVFFASDGDGERIAISTSTNETVVWVDQHGLRRPRQTVPWAPGWFGNTVDSSGYQATAEAWVRHSYPTMRMQYRVVRSGSPTVQVRLRDMGQDSTVVGPFTHSDSGRSTVDVELPTSIHESRRYELQAQISGGSGSARVDVTRCEVGFFPDFNP